jgi:hypothetical protein
MGARLRGFLTRSNSTVNFSLHTCRFPRPPTYYIKQIRIVSSVSLKILLDYRVIE